tara:strand:+ start:405 stop:1001 length:597 start_codon:yes stop_codon:yes gene_type:complete
MKLATLFNKLTKNKNKFVNIFILIGIVVLVGVLFKYNNQKMIIQDSMGNNPFANVASVENTPSKNANVSQQIPIPNQKGAQPVMTTDGDQFLNVKGLSSGKKPTNTCNNQPVMDPKELLPSDSNNEWSNIMPNNDLKNVGMLNAGHHVGINTVGSSLRNANLQIRSEPVIPQTNIGPWNNTTIEADNLRRPLELGAAE